MQSDPSKSGDPCDGGRKLQLAGALAVCSAYFAPATFTQQTIDDYQHGIASWAAVRQWSLKPFDFSPSPDLPCCSMTATWHSRPNALHYPSSLIQSRGSGSDRRRKYA